MRPHTTVRFAAAAVLIAGALSITACSEKREAEAEAGNATAEVTTTAPDTMISNTELNAAAMNAAGAADPTGATANLTEGAGSTTAPN
ncbi:MAG: hypothetical protein B7Y99_13000 [Caulobacterales bacterium 32-69-10]|nr:MAG: hypothetical protein B7Y99_13000 [Caulobacterales bacterium 32-69-10]